MNHKANTLVGIAFVIIFIGLGALFIFSSHSRDVNAENNAYIRVIDCIISKNAVNRSQEDIETCYQSVERDTQVHLKRYDIFN